MLDSGNEAPARASDIEGEVTEAIAASAVRRTRAPV
jgi:hypothetical protein